jgi:hypothetical protein
MLASDINWLRTIGPGFFIAGRVYARSLLREGKYVRKIAGQAEICKSLRGNEPALANSKSQINAVLQTRDPIRFSDISQIFGPVPMFQKLRKI